MEFKFRAWHKRTKKYIEHGELYNLDCSNEFPFLALAMGLYKDEDMDVVLEQYTGVNDCDGKEIYVGDILSDPFEQDYVVKFNNDFASFFLYPIGNEEKFMAFYKNIRMTVIGNAHENKDLLEIS